MYVGKKNTVTGDITLCTNEELFSKVLTAHSANWIALDRLDAPLRVQAKVRYAHTASPATIWQLDDTSVRVEFDEPQRAIAAGQSVVFYDGDLLLGGGIINA